MITPTLAYKIMHTQHTDSLKKIHCMLLMELINLPYQITTEFRQGFCPMGGTRTVYIKLILLTMLTTITETFIQVDTEEQQYTTPYIILVT